MKVIELLNELAGVEHDAEVYFHSDGWEEGEKELVVEVETGEVNGGRYVLLK